MARQRASCHSTVPWISSTPDELDSEEHLLPYIRCHPMGRYAVASATLLRHHAANERAQESAMGVVETLSVAHAVLLGCTQQCTSLTSAAYTHSAVEQSAATSSSLLSDPAAVPPTAAIGSTALVAAPGQPVTTMTAAGALAAKRKRGVAHVLATSDMDMDDDEEPSVRKLRSKVDRAIDKIVQHRAKRSSALEKLELQRDRARTQMESAPRRGSQRSERHQICSTAT